MGNITEIPGRLKAVDMDGVVAGARDILDDELQQRQSEINKSMLKSIKGTTKVVSITANTDAVEHPETDTQIDVIYVNDTQDELFVSVSNRQYRTPDGGVISLTVPAGGYAEVNFMNISGIVYVRGM